MLTALIALPLALALRLALPVTRGGWVLLVTSALGGFVLFPVLFTLGLRDTSASHAALILASLAVFTGLIAAAFERKPPRARWWLGAAIASIGEALLIGARFGFEKVEGALFGDLLIVASCVAASAGYVTGGRLSRSLGAWPTTLWGITIGGVMLLPALPFAAAGVAWSAVGASGALAIGYLAVVSSLLAYVTWYWALGAGGIGRVGTWQFAMPIVSLGLAVVILAEPLSWPLAGSAVVILAGIWIAGR